MPDIETIVPKTERSIGKMNPSLPATRGTRPPADPRQRGLMMGALCLLLFALSVVLWHDRDFWFPDTPEADSDEPVESPSGNNVATGPAVATAHRAKAASTKRQAARHQAAPQAEVPAADDAPPGATITARTVLPPLEVEVVAGDTHRTIRPGSNSVHVELQPDTPPPPAADAPAARDSKTAANVPSEAPERVQMSATTSDAVTSPARPNYPLLARQMKVQGSVILQALISRDGVIQNLRVVSGPHILASAAQDAVRQWHFKPHYQGDAPVETEAKITVNFTISTN